jgi:hypothetical protein
MRASPEGEPIPATLSTASSAERWAARKDSPAHPGKRSFHNDRLRVIAQFG